MVKFSNITPQVESIQRKRIHPSISLIFRTHSLMDMFINHINFFRMFITLIIGLSNFAYKKKSDYFITF